MPQFSAHSLNRLFAALPADAPLAVAVSGGGDSMALLHLLLNWRGSPAGLVALTVNHGLRAEAAAEARQVKAWCNDLGVEHHTLTWRHGPVATGLQAKARAARYGLMTAFCRKHHLAALLTAHTVEDQAETVAMRAKRTQSPRALAAIWPQTEVDGIAVHRPLLGESRAAMRAYLTDQRQAWLEDPSNDNDAFERVRLRRSAPSPALARTATAAQREVTATDAKALRWCTKHLTVEDHGLIRFAPQAFEKLGAPVADAVLLRVITLAGGETPEAARRKSLVAWLQERVDHITAPRRTLGGVLFAKRKAAVLVAREPARIDARPIKLTGGKPVIWDGRFEVQGPTGSTIVCRTGPKALNKKDDIPAFVRNGWPLVMQRGKLLASPQQQNHPAAKITFIKK